MFSAWRMRCSSCQRSAVESPLSTALELGLRLFELPLRRGGVDVVGRDRSVDERDRAVLEHLEEARAGRELLDLRRRRCARASSPLSAARRAAHGVRARRSPRLRRERSPSRHRLRTRRPQASRPRPRRAGGRPRAFPTPACRRARALQLASSSARSPQASRAPAPRPPSTWPRSTACSITPTM